MKTNTVALLLALSVLPLAAQNAPPIPGVRVPSPRRVQAPPSRPATEDSNRLKENLSIRLHGNIATGEKIDLTLTGIGPTFTADRLTNDTPNHLRCSYSLVKEGDHYLLQYSIGIRMRITVGTSGNNVSYEYRDISNDGTILCQLGKPVVVAKEEPNHLTLIISKPDESPETAPPSSSDPKTAPETTSP